jgi:beta-lactamase class A
VGKQKFLVVCLIVSAIVNILLGVYVYKGSDKVKSVEDFGVAQERYPLLSKRILQEFPQDVLINFLALRMSLKQQVAPYGSSFGFYFEYLPTGTSIGVNEKDEFHAASLFKVPVIMAYYHLKERTHKTDDPTITLTHDMLDSEFGDLWKKGEGYKLSASEAIKLALTESDNTAAKAIVPFVTDQDFNSVYEALDIDLHADQKGAYVSAKSYASILKALYFSSVLTKDSSEEILDLLTKTKFPDKMVAGVPDDIVVSHKIGNFEDKDGKEGFRDCGIVYAPRRPYMLCMFSVGDEQTAKERMQAVSKTVYDYVVSEK